MPPEGFESVTLPEELVERLDAVTTRAGAESRADAIERLLDGELPDLEELTVNTVTVEDVDEGVLTDLSGRVAKDVVDELETRRI